jgi:ParB family chromosome partitioning protein
MTSDSYKDPAEGSGDDSVEQPADPAAPTGRDHGPGGGHSVAEQGGDPAGDAADDAANDAGDESGAPRKHLGRGLAALLGDEEDDYAELDKVRQSKAVPIEFLHPGRFQPRREFAAEALQSLVRSIIEKGVLQPILVRRHPEQPNAYEIVAGERRWRAAQLAQLHEVPVLIREFTDRDALEVALVENLQREDLTPLEEAEAYQRLLDEFAESQEDLARVVGHSRSHVANMLRLLTLPEPVKQMLHAGALSAGHARALVGTEEPETLAREVIRRGLNVRQTERLVQKEKEKNGTAAPRRAKAKPEPAEGADANTRELEQHLSNRLGLKVEIKFDGHRGTIAVHYSNLEQLDDIVRRLSHDLGQDGLE